MNKVSASNMYMHIPHSQMEWSPELGNRCKFFFWKIYTPFHPLVRDIALATGIVSHSGRQKYLFGTLRSDRLLNDFISYLSDSGYRNHFVAWKDEGEVLSLRKTNGFTHQYHVRVFEDGEVRAHYEFTPEYKPLDHMREVGMNKQKEIFTNLFSDWLQ